MNATVVEIERGLDLERLGNPYIVHECSAITNRGTQPLLRGGGEFLVAVCWRSLAEDIQLFFQASRKRFTRWSRVCW
jgi:hypothetical protein